MYEIEMDQIEMQHPKLPKWLRVAFMDDDGRVFLPCGAFGNEMLALFCIAADGVFCVRNNKHTYAPASWLAQLHPHMAEDIQTIAVHVKRRITKKKSACGAP